MGTGPLQGESSSSRGTSIKSALLGNVMNKGVLNSQSLYMEDSTDPKEKVMVMGRPGGIFSPHLLMEWPLSNSSKGYF